MSYRICSRCVMDTSDPLIRFDQEGRCNHCTAAIARMRAQLLPPKQRDQALATLVAAIKKDGQDKEYDCIAGISGGVDSTMTIYLAKQLGLRPYIVHFDNSWNSELAVHNIHRTLVALNLDLDTYVVDWEEFRDLQLAFLRSSVANCEAPTDHGIMATLFKSAKKLGLRFILTGSNVATEAIMPYAWSHFAQDLRQLQAIHRRFGTKPLNTMPLIGVGEYLDSVLVRKVRQIPFLNFVDYNKQAAKDTLARELGWRDYGGKHYESVWTRFFQGYYLPVKFGYDKRRAHYSTLICAGQMSRDQAVAALEAPVYDEDLLRQDRQFVLKKFGLTAEEFDRLLKQPPKEARDYPSNYFLFSTLGPVKNLFRAIATSPYGPWQAVRS